MTKRAFGSARRQASGRWQVRYKGPNGKSYTGRTDDNRPLTFDKQSIAQKYLDRVSTAIQDGTWVPPDAKTADAPETLAGYAETWLATRLVRGRDLSPSTRKLYRHTLDKQILGPLGDRAITEITKADVRKWYAGLPTGPTQRAHAYRLLATIMGTAVRDDVITVNPCQISGAGSVQRAGQTGRRRSPRSRRSSRRCRSDSG